MPSLVDDLLPLVDLSNSLQEEFGLLEYAVTIRLERYASAIGDGVAALTPVDLAISPRVPVAQLPPEQAFGYGGGPLAAAGGAVRDVFKIGPLAPQYTDATGTHGVTIADLLPTPSGPAQRAVVIVNGPLTKNTDAVCEAVGLAADPFGRFLIVRRTLAT